MSDEVVKTKTLLESAHARRGRTMCCICGKVLGLDFWKIFGKCFCSKRCVDAYEKQEYEAGHDL